jgi:hypothetical protein
VRGDAGAEPDAAGYRRIIAEATEGGFAKLIALRTDL